MEKKDIRSDLLKSFGMESRAFTWLEEIKRNVSSDEKMYNLTVGSPDGMPEDEIVETMVQQVREPEIIPMPRCPATSTSGKRWRNSIRSATTSLLIRLPR